MDKKKPLPTFIEIESVIRPGVSRMPSAKPVKTMKTKTDGKGSSPSAVSVKSK